MDENGNQPFVPSDNPDREVAQVMGNRNLQDLNPRQGQQPREAARENIPAQRFLLAGAARVLEEVAAREDEGRQAEENSEEQAVNVAQEEEQPKDEMAPRNPQ